MLYVVFAEFILYICFSVLIGSLILFIVPEDKKPLILIPKKILVLAVGLIPVAAFFPVFQTASILAANMDLAFVLKNVIFTFEIGKSWLFITIVSVILMIVLLRKNSTEKRHLLVWALVLSLLMLVGYTRSSHAATITEWQGFIFQTLHFLSVVVWIGILFIVSWFAKNKTNWLAFLRWFTPVALTCLTITIVAGYFIMKFDINSYDAPDASIVQDYQNSLLVNYGQSLLVKHIFILSLVLFALTNGFLFRRKYGQESYNPLKWARLESVYALIVFGLTAFMGQSWPPHQIYSLLKTEGASPLFKAVYDGEILNRYQQAESNTVLNVTMTLGVDSFVLFGLAIIFLAVTLFAATIRKSVFVSTFASLLMILAIYLGIMVGIR
ncbi:copper resistance D family protein [Virgibacillus flavescens]|uniref:copper resistance D family protein n=1 Tax=Virgibacillus flavescens TaxID=1611422 RepID=UPI003D3286AA